MGLRFFIDYKTLNAIAEVVYTHLPDIQTIPLESFRVGLSDVGTMLWSVSCNCVVHHEKTTLISAM